MRIFHEKSHGGAIRSEPLPGWLNGVLVGATFAGLILLELRRPLRHRSVESKARRNIRNLAVAGISAGVLQLVERPVTGPVSRWVERRHFGLLKRFSLSPGWEIALAILLLDYTLYLWHVLTHRSPLLWRFHKVHHVDLDMDASTAVRFHFGELTISILWRVAQICLIGVCPRALSVWQTALLMEILFHHSNVEMPVRWERWLSRIIVTPRLHEIHHSIVERETNSNWSSGLTVWDLLHRTLRLHKIGHDIIIGVQAYQDARELTLPKLMEMPFGGQRPSWPALV